MNIGILILMIIGGGVGVLSSLILHSVFRQSLSGKFSVRSATDINLHIKFYIYFTAVFRSCSISSISDRISSCCLSNNNFLLY